MIRAFHRWPGLLALALVTILALSGAMLAVFPAFERVAAPQAEPRLSLATLALRVQTAYPGVEQIRRAPSGRITAYWFDANTPGAAVIDPATGLGVASADPNQTQRWLTNLHRSLFLDDTGRIVMAVGAAAMLLLSLSGIALIVRRVGGWRHWFVRLRGPLAGRIHVEIARLAVLGLVLSAATALWMTASTFDLLPDAAAKPAFPADVSGEMSIALSEIALLQSTPVGELRTLTFPAQDDATDAFLLKTDLGTGYLDQGTGLTLSWVDLSGWAHLTEVMYMLHTGQGAAALGLVLGLAALSVPAMGVTGVLVWWSGRRGRPRIRGNRPAGQAETILLVGSEGGSTFGFAATLHTALTKAGQSVHLAPMSAFAPAHYARAKRIIVLAATYGDGAAPASAKGFLDRLAAMDQAHAAPLAVLGFGDSSFPRYCAFAQAVSATAKEKNWPELIPFDTVDRQSSQSFARWGRALGHAMGITLELTHQPVLYGTQSLKLISRRDYGAEVQAPTAILRFALPRLSFWQRLTGAGFARFQAGDLLAVLPEGSPVARLYSLASARRDGFVEIVVRKQAGGLCSGQLMALEPGDTITAAPRRNPGFHADKSRSPLILVGAGTGIGPLAGIIRGNTRKRPIHLFFGMRHPDSDFLYSREMPVWKAEERLTQLVGAISRGAKPEYVQDALRRDAPNVIRLIRDGARIMVCGGHGMAAGVADALAEILTPTGLTPAQLKAEGRYVEDTY